MPNDITVTKNTTSGSERWDIQYTADQAGTIDKTLYAAGKLMDRDEKVSITIPSGTAGTPTATKGTVSSNSISVTPSVTNIAGFITSETKTGTAVTVSASELVSGTKNITASGTTDVTNYANASVSAMTLPTSTSTTSSGTNKATIGRSTSAQYINIPTGYNNSAAYYTISAVPNGSVTAPSSITDTGATVSFNPQNQNITLTKDISVTPNVTTAGYISSGTAGTSTVALSAQVGTVVGRTITPTTSEQTIISSAGAYYVSGAVKVGAMATGSVTAPSSISGSSATVSTGTNTLTLSKTVSVTPNVTTAGYISSGTAGNSSVSLTASVTTKAAATITPSTTDQTIASDTYLTGMQTISGDANLVAGNIKKDVPIFGVTGTYEGAAELPPANGEDF